jgi:hypothetical protein
MSVARDPGWGEKMRNRISAAIAVFLCSGCGGVGSTGVSSAPGTSMLKSGTYLPDGPICSGAEEAHGPSQVILDGTSYIWTYPQYSDSQCANLRYTLVSTGRLAATTTAMSWTQQSLTLTPAAGQAGALQLSCPGTTLTDSVSTDVEGRNCAGKAFNSDGTTYVSILGAINSTSFWQGIYDNIAVGTGEYGGAVFDIGMLYSLQ